MTRTWSLILCTLAGSAIAAAVSCLLYAGYAGAWLSLGVVFFGVAAYGLAIFAITLLAIGLLTSSRRWPWGVAILACCASVAMAHAAAIRIAHSVRDREIRKALDAGLEADCRIVFAEYQADPKLQQDGYVRVFEDSDEFDSLPASIRMLNPVYVTIEDHPFGSDMPANIGLCKDGFGGFAFGVRVFLDGKPIPETFWRKRITPRVYLWQEET